MSEYPEHYLWLESKFGEAIKTHESMGEQLKEAGPIEGKWIHLIQLAAAAAIRSEGGVHSHVRRALKEKASPEEIYHSLVLLTSTIGFPTVAAALSWARDILKQEKRP